MSNSETIAIACDHAGVVLKRALKEHLRRLGHAVLDLGTDSEESVDYPDFAGKMADALADGRAQRGILICGTGIGISIAANRYDHVRAALCLTAEMAAMSREHNDANVIVFGARLMTASQACHLLDVFLTTAFAGGRHERRVAKLKKGGC